MCESTSQCVRVEGSENPQTDQEIVEQWVVHNYSVQL